MAPERVEFVGRVGGVRFYRIKASPILETTNDLTPSYYTGESFTRRPIELLRCIRCGRQFDGWPSFNQHQCYRRVA